MHQLATWEFPESLKILADPAEERGVKLALGAIVVSMVVVAAAPAPAFAADGDRDGQIILQYRPGVSAGERADVRADADVEHVRSLTLPDTAVVAADAPADRAQAIADLNADPDVAWAEADRSVHAFADTVGWGLVNDGSTGGVADADIDVDDAWTVTKGAGATVATVDTGAQLDHPDLAGRIVASADYVTGDSQTTAQDGNGHGTHVAGIIAAAENGAGSIGVAPAASLVVARALSNNGSGSTSDVVAAYGYAARNARIVNASLGSTTPSSAERQLIAGAPNTLFVVAAGNSGANNDATPTYPCAYPLANILCVGASDASDARASFSNYGATTVDLFAPGKNVFSDYLGSSYATMSGTSMAAPAAAGAAALVLAAHPSYTAAQLKEALLTSVDPVPALAGLAVTGGRLNAGRAVGAAVTATANVTAPVAAPVAPVLAPAPARLSRLRVRKRRGQARSLSFRLSAPAAVAVTVSRVQGGHAANAGSRTVHFSGGAHALAVGAKLAGIRLGKGSFRVVLQAPGNRASVALVR